MTLPAVIIADVYDMVVFVVLAIRLTSPKNKFKKKSCEKAVGKKTHKTMETGLSNLLFLFCKCFEFLWGFFLYLGKKKRMAENKNHKERKKC